MKTNLPKKIVQALRAEDRAELERLAPKRIPRDIDMEVSQAAKQMAMNAMRQDDAVALRLLIQLGMDPSMDVAPPTSSPWSLLGMACRKGAKNVIRVLAEGGASLLDAHIGAKAPDAPLYIAFHHHDSGVLDALVNGAMQFQNGDLPKSMRNAHLVVDEEWPKEVAAYVLHRTNAAAAAGDVEDFNRLWHAGGQWVLRECVDHGSCDDLMSAIRGDQPQILDCYLDLGIPLHSYSTALGDAPIHMAAQFGSIDVMRHLVKLGCDLDQHNATGHTAGHIIASTGSAQTREQWQHLGGDLGVRDAGGSTLAHVASSCNHPDLIVLVISQHNFRDV